ncbi:hypothetical protein GCM10010517_36630 [Streptosporangium fragile]|uniref:ANTAR domain-containing protein n=1 Tax=Streptosporangium fragile TaxID=46186 RepID=A0ABP6IEG4_9ACTN
MTTNTELADLAQAIADQAPAGSLTRRAAGCLVVAYSTTRTAAHARRVLADLDDQLRAACHTLADQLTAQTTEEEP